MNTNSKEAIGMKEYIEMAIGTNQMRTEFTI